MIKDQQNQKSKSQKAKEGYNWIEGKAANKFTVASILFAIIGPLLIKILEALGMIIFVVPFNEQLTVYINMTLLISILVAMLVVLYAFHEWKLRIDIKRAKFVEKDKLHNLINEEFTKLNQTITTKAKENVMSNAVLIDSINQPKEIRKETEKLLQTIDFSPNGVDDMDTNKMREYIENITKEVDKQEDANMKADDEEQDRLKEALGIKPSSSLVGSGSGLARSVPKEPEPEEDSEPEPEVKPEFRSHADPDAEPEPEDREYFRDGVGNTYYLDENDERKFV